MYIWLAVFNATQEAKPLFPVHPCVLVLSCQQSVFKYMLMLSLLEDEDSQGLIFFIFCLLHAGKMLQLDVSR